MRLTGQRAKIGFLLLLLVPAFGLMALGILDRTGGWKPSKMFFAEEEDGSWVAVSIDGRPASPEEYRITIAEGEVVGGRDGCNDWSYEDEEPDAKGERMIVSTLVGCPEDATRQAYWLLRGDPRIELLPNGTLRLAAPGHEGIFRRCDWKTVRVSNGRYWSEARECVPEGQGAAS